MLHPRPATLPARRTCRRFRPLRPASRGWESGPGRGGGGCAPAGTAAGGKLRGRAFCGCLIAAWPWAKLPRPRRAPHFPFPLLGGGCAVRAPRGAHEVPGPDDTFAGGEDCLSAQARLPLPSLPPPTQSSPRPLPPEFPAEPAVRGGAANPLGKGTGTGAQNPAGFRRAQLLQLQRRWALSAPGCS